MPRDAMYLPHIGNQVVPPFQMYLDRTVHDDILWTPFEDHREIIPFDSISLYSEWLACGTDTMVGYLPELCMQQFGYVQTTLRSQTQVVRDTIARRDLDDIFEDWEQHMVLEEYRLMQASSN
ncbi:uncharacterized protein LOC131597955 [Vicia villosa]|uniref:uncharacterized protein LOC131597955 n=1 Tax=Vicia villosa TaxID=3911 RepID=UPI00273BA9C6|nr:uncharacterized protein LOC131597955 [Vicia villosa]